jgi:hypothetical protein
MVETTENYGEGWMPSREGTNVEANPVVEQAEENTCLLNPGCLFNQIPQLRDGERMSMSDLKQLRWIVVGVLLVVFLLIAIPIFFMTYPFKTVVFTQPIRILNPAKKVMEDGSERRQVPVNGVVHMDIHYEKFIDNPGLVIRTLIRKRGKEIQVLDSSTVVTTRKKGKGATDATFTLNPNSYMVGDDTYVVFSIYYTLFGVRPIMVQFETEAFEITAVPGLPALPCPPPGQHWDMK